MGLKLRCCILLLVMLTLISFATASTSDIQIVGSTLLGESADYFRIELDEGLDVTASIYDPDNVMRETAEADVDGTKYTFYSDVKFDKYGEWYIEFKICDVKCRKVSQMFEVQDPSQIDPVVETPVVEKTATTSSVIDLTQAQCNVVAIPTAIVFTSDEQTKTITIINGEGSVFSGTTEIIDVAGYNSINGKVVVEDIGKISPNSEKKINLTFTNGFFNEISKGAGILVIQSPYCKNVEVELLVNITDKNKVQNNEVKSSFNDFYEELNTPLIGDTWWSEPWFAIFLFGIFFIAFLWNADFSSSQFPNIIYKVFAWAGLMIVSMFVMYILIKVITG